MNVDTLRSGIQDRSDGSRSSSRAVDEPGAKNDDGQPKDPKRTSDVGDAKHDAYLLALRSVAKLLARPISEVKQFERGGAHDQDPLMRLRKAAVGAGLQIHVREARVRDLEQVALPAIILLKNGGATVATRRLGADVIEILNPLTGQSDSFSVQSVEKSQTGIVVFVTERSQPRGRTTFLDVTRERSWLWGPIANNKWNYGNALIGTTVTNILALALPLFIMNVYDRVVPNDAVETLWVLTLGVMGAAVVDFIIRTLRGYFIDIAARRADVDVSRQIFRQLLSLKAKARPNSVGSLANVVREFDVLRDFSASATLATFGDLPFVVLFIFIVWVIGGPIAIIPIAAIPTILGVGLALQIPLSGRVNNSFRNTSNKNAVLVELLGGFDTIKGLGADRWAERRWEEEVGVAAQSGLGVRLWSAVALNFAAFMQVLVSVSLVIAGVYLIQQGEMTVGGLIACMILNGRVVGPLAQLAQLLVRLHHAKLAYRTLSRLMESPTERPAGHDIVRRPEIKGGLEFRNVSFAYEGDAQPILEDVSFRIDPGEHVAVLGRTGSGKSTLLKLALDLYQPDHGAVYADGVDIRQLDPVDLRSAVGFVPQDVTLFDGTVRENITLGAIDAEDSTILEAAKMTGVDEFISASRQGYDLRVGEGGSSLSGGQRQAIALARALLLKPSILLLDEPTSALDHRSEASFISRMSGFLKSRTLVLVTHRQSMLTLVDRIIVLEGGRVVADGPRDVVLRQLSGAPAAESRLSSELSQKAQKADE